ncbi:MAG: SAM-dependent methyltransferase [Bacteroidales bacterium]|nr:SAM-dependent methyltransferase [Bacteroidales bacterium]
MRGKIYLIPSEMGEQASERLFPPYNVNIIMSLQYFIVENARTARRFVKKVCPNKKIEEAFFLEINKHNPTERFEEKIKPLIEGFDVGIISEAGMPCIADPGNIFVAQAHRLGIQVVPLVGPNSIIMALIASGFNGQNFSFHGYVPIKEDRKKLLLIWETKALQTKETQIFMETPYRNQQLFEDLIAILKPNTNLCIATDITLQTEEIRTKSIAEWRKEKPNLLKRPSIFLIL